MLNMIGVYEVQYDTATNEFVLEDKEGQRGQIRGDSAEYIACKIEMDIYEQMAGTDGE